MSRPSYSLLPHGLLTRVFRKHTEYGHPGIALEHESGLDYLLERRFIANHQDRALELDQLPLLEIRKQPADRFAAGSDHLPDFFVSKGKTQPVGGGRVFVVGSPCQKKLGKFLGR